jgi:hypothetical protein
LATWRAGVYDAASRDQRRRQERTMPDYQQQIRSLIKRYEVQARKQIKALQSRAKKQLPQRRQQLLKAVRQLRKMVNAQLGALERRLMAAGKKR